MSTMVECPVCEQLVPETFINAHIDSLCSAFLSTSASASAGPRTSSQAVAPSRGGAPSLAGQPRPTSDAVKRKNANHEGEAPPEVAPSSSRVLSTPTSTPVETHLSKRPRVATASTSLASSRASSSSTAKPPTTTMMNLNSARPLPDLVRPQKLSDLIGQEHLLGPGMLLRGLIERDAVGSIRFWGPPGTGKTTIARVIAKTTSSIFKELSATSASTADLRKVFEEATNVLKLTGKKTVLFIDEIQRFNKGLQDLFLPVVESGLISLIASTTENPSFRVNAALLSRCRVFVLEKLGEDAVYRILLRALTVLRDEHGRGAQLNAEDGVHKGKDKDASTNPDPTASPDFPTVNDESILPSYPTLDSSLLRFLASAADGDARVALSSLELALAATHGGSKAIDREELKAGLRKAHLQYDRSGDHHYDTISALHKSIRGSDANAGLYWLARMLEGGDDPLYVARRLIRMASEDVGLANPQALGMAVAAYQATQVIGMPECDCILAQVVVMLAESPKSIRTYSAYKAAKSLVRNTENYPVPLHIRNAPTGLMKKLGYGRDYRYEPSFAHPVHQPFLPPELAGDGSAAAFLTDDSDIRDKTIDEGLLREWEWKRRGGAKWEGREELERKRRELEREIKPALGEKES
ncbi:hypothetical protein JCM10212_006804 [Sporobolomyces blumeae]